MAVDRRHWLRHVKEVIRSRHYTWLPRGLGGEKVDAAMAYLLTDIMHICKLAGVSFDDLLADARGRFATEESAELPAPNPLGLPPAITGDAIVAAYETNDPFEAEIVRARLEGEDIACRVDSRLQGGLKGKVDAKIVVESHDAERAATIVESMQDFISDLEA